MDIDDGDYPNLDEIAIFGIQTYRNSVGDDSPPGYSFWSNQINSEQTTIPYIMIALIWFMWFMNQFFVMIIL